MKNYMYTFTFIISLIVGAPLYSQCNIKNCPSCSSMIQKSVEPTNIYRGQVLDELSGEPAMFATIMLTNEVNHLGTVSDMDGLYSLVQIPDGEYDVTVKLIGYETYVKKLSIRNGIVTDKIKMKVSPTCVCGCPLIIEPISDVIQKEEREQPTAGYEGHNFIENPAIIYPNPARDHFNLRSTDPITVIEILNITGEVAVDKMMPANNQVDISNLAAGQYFVRIFFENRKEVQIERMIVVR